MLTSDVLYSCCLVVLFLVSFVRSLKSVCSFLYYDVLVSSTSPKIETNACIFQHFVYVTCCMCCVSSPSPMFSQD